MHRYVLPILALLIADSASAANRVQFSLDTPDCRPGDAVEVRVLREDGWHIDPARSYEEALKMRERILQKGELLREGPYVVCVDPRSVAVAGGVEQ